jgi:hypothetical protein
VRLSRDFRLSVPSTTGSVRREDFSLYAGSFAEGFTILFPFFLIKSHGERMPLPTRGKPHLNRQEEMSWSSCRRRAPAYPTTNSFGLFFFDDATVGLVIDRYEKRYVTAVPEKGATVSIGHWVLRCSTSASTRREEGCRILTDVRRAGYAHHVGQTDVQSSFRRKQVVRWRSFGYVLTLAGTTFEQLGCTISPNPRRK